MRNWNKPGVIIIEGHVQGLSNTRSLGEAGIPVYIIDKTNCIARYSKFCKKFFICPDFNTREFIEFLIMLARSESLKDWILLPSNDHAVLSISRHRNILSEFYKIITPEERIISNIYDKSRLLSIAENIGISVPTTKYFKTEDDPIDKSIMFPVLTKGRHGLDFYKAVKKKAYLAMSEQELRNQLKQIRNKCPLENTFTQELIPDNGTNKTVSFTAFCISGEIKTYWAGEKVREHPVRFGTATFARSIDGSFLLTMSKRLLHALNYTGVCEIEYLLDPRDNKYKLIEINARTWLWVGLAKESGIDYAKLIYDYLNDKSISFPEKYNINIGWVNYITDIPFSIMGLFKGKLSIKEYLSTFQIKVKNASFAWNDLMPGIMFLLLSFYIALKRR